MVLAIASEQEFKNVVSSNQKVVVLCSASWCAPCVKYTPVYESLKTKFSDVVFCKIDCSNDVPEFIADVRQNCSQLPSCHFWYQGRLQPEKNVNGANAGKILKGLNF